MSPTRAKTTDELTALRTWLRLLSSTRVVESEVRRRLRDQFDTTLPRFDVLAQLDAASREGRPGLTMTELASRLMMTNGNITGLVERLVQDRLVSRETSRDDGRVQLVRLTAAGNRALSKMLPEHHAWIDELFGGMSPAELSKLYAMLGKLRGSLRDALDEEPVE